MLLADLVVIGLRGLAFAAALHAAGGPIFLLLFGSRLDLSARRVRGIVVWSAVAGLLLVSLHATVQPARLAGTLSGMFDASLHKMLLASDFGTTVSLRLAGLALVLAGVLGTHVWTRFAAPGGTVLIVASFALMGHTASDPQRWILAPLLIVHLLAVAFWFGGLWPLLAAARCEKATTAGTIVTAYSRAAIRLVPLILIAGIAIAALLLDGWQSLRTPYGFALIGKASVFALLMLLAATNRWRFGPALSHGRPAAATGFRFTVVSEWCLILGVLMLTAVMTSLFSPHGH